MPVRSNQVWGPPSSRPSPIHIAEYASRVHRRQFLAAGAAGLGLALLGSLDSYPGAAAQPFGAQLTPTDDGLFLPPGFTSRVIARTGEPVGPTDHLWHPNPDGGATFAKPDGGWIYVSNDESNNGRGGVSMIGFDSTGEIVDARSILAGTNRNCAGGTTPWGTWLSCECDPQWGCSRTRQQPPTLPTRSSI